MRLTPSIAVVLLLAQGLPEAGVAEEGHVWQSHPNHLSLLVAGTDDDEATAVTFGIDYERRLNAFLGVGAVVEHAFDDIDATSVLLVADLHVWRGLAIQTGPGIEFIDGSGEEDDEEEFIYRFGALYELEFGRATFSPQVHYDISTGEDAVIFGGAIGYSF